MCKYCYTIASAVSVLFPEIQNQTMEQITLAIEVWGGRPVEIFVENFEEYGDLWLNIFAINGMLKYSLD
jgi:hypothetical protein